MKNKVDDDVLRIAMHTTASTALAFLEMCVGASPTDETKLEGTMACTPTSDDVIS